MSDPSANGIGGNGSPKLELENLGGGAAEPGSTSPRMLVPLFLVPLLIVAVIVGVFLGLGSMLGQQKTVAQWIGEIETGGVNERWQAAAQLTEISRSDPGKLDDPQVRAKLRHLFTSAGPTEPRIRQYLAQLWTTIDDPEAASLMVDGIRRTRELLAHPESAAGPGQATELENAGRELIYYVRALGTIGTSTCEVELLTLIDDPDKSIREAVAEALGATGRKAIKSGGAPSAALVAALLKLHGDDEPWVRMNAALSLGKLGRTEGLPTLEAMLDREWLRRQKLQFPDDGKYSVTMHDPAAVPILSALITIGALVEPGAVGGATLDRAALRSAVEKAAADPNPELQRRAKDLLEKLGS